MISFDDVTLLVGGRPLLESVDLTLHAGQRIGVIGPNGCGKTSFFKLLQGDLHADTGNLHIPSKLRIAHMVQEADDSSQAAVDHVMNGDKTLRAIEAKISLAEANHQDDLLGGLYAQLEAIDGYSAKNRAEQLLHGLSFTQEELLKPVNEFSGGWRIRLNLAQALMAPSDLLLLDEPTNHLDLDATLWLEQWLKTYPGTLILISHDRDFLDGVAQSILSFDGRELYQYKGNYSSYEKQRAERLANQQANYEKQQQRVKEIQDFVRRFRAKATKAKQAQSRLKELERMEQIAPAHIDSPFQFKFPESEKSSSPLLALSEAQLGYSNSDQPNAILKNVDISLLPGTRIGLLGANGAGKSTLIKTLVNQLSLISGERTEGEHLKIGYFAQHQLELLDEHASPLLQLQRITPTAREQDIRNFLGGFDFRGDVVLSPITNFSGGEKARLVLATIAWQKPNLLLLDEPTNHLDIEMRHALTLALQEFSGAILIISHDRHLLRNTVDNFLLVADNQVQEYKGDLSEYQKFITEKSQSASTSKEMESSDTPAKSGKKNERQKSADIRKKLNPLKNRIKKLEANMEGLHQKLSEIETQLADSAIYEENAKEKLQALLQEQRTLQASAETAEEEWLTATEELETIEALR